jgi:hypothetical protein
MLVCFFLGLIRILLLVLRKFLEPNRCFTLKMDSDVRDCYRFQLITQTAVHPKPVSGTQLDSYSIGTESSLSDATAPVTCR